MTNKTELLKKIRELALRGVDGEQEQAKKMLAKLMEKYGIKEEAVLDDNHRETVDFEFHGREEKEILTHIAYKVTDNHVFWGYRNASGRRKRTVIGIDCTEAERIQILFLFDFYKSLYKQEAEFFLKAFILKHQLFGKPDDEAEKVYLTEEESIKMSALMSGMKDCSPILRLDGGDKT